MKISQKLFPIFIVATIFANIDAMPSSKPKTTKHVTFNEKRNTVHQSQQYENESYYPTQWITEDNVANNIARQRKEKEIDNHLLCASIIITFAIGAYYINYFSTSSSENNSK